jgi:ABC-type glycerol-3-phosphate transport system substrate-binding protein
LGSPTGPCEARSSRKTDSCRLVAGKEPDAAWAYASWGTQGEAQRISPELKRNVPARKSVAGSGDFERALSPWESAALYREASEKVRGFPLSSTYDDINKLFGTAYNSVLDGAAAPKDAVGRVLPQMNQLLAQKE